MDYATFLRGQWQDLVDAWLGLDDRLGLNTAWIALPDMSWVARLAEPGFPGGAGRWSPLPGTPPTEALMRFDAKSRPQLWVKPEDKAEGDGRYAAYWAAFVRQLGQAAPASEVNGQKLAVDHLFPETAAARRGWLLVRSMPVDRRSNSLLGSTTEKVDANRGGVHRPRKATALTIAKVTGFQGSFARRHDPKSIAGALLAHLRGCGLRVPDNILLPDDEEGGMIAGLIGFYRR
jgi:hypothetical protein